MRYGEPAGTRVCSIAWHADQVPLCPKGVARVQECASQRNPRKVCQLEGGAIYHVLPGLEGRVYGWGAGMSLETLSFGTFGQSVKLKTPHGRVTLGQNKHQTNGSQGDRTVW